LAEAPKRAPPPEKIAFGFYAIQRGVKRGRTGFSFGECCDNDWIVRKFWVVGDECVILGRSDRAFCDVRFGSHSHHKTDTARGRGCANFGSRAGVDAALSS
jgi:hypothetical protein